MSEHGLLRGGHQTDTRKAENTKKAFNPIKLLFKNYFNKVIWLKILKFTVSCFLSIIKMFKVIVMF